MTPDELRAAIPVALRSTRREMGEYCILSVALLGPGCPEVRALRRAVRGLRRADVLLRGDDRVMADDLRAIGRPRCPVTDAALAEALDCAVSA